MQSILLTTIRKITATLEWISPKLAARWANKLFFSPRSSKRKLPDIPNLQQSWLSYTKTSGDKDKCRVYTVGAGPVVLLVHGWEGSSYSFSVIAKALLREGMKVVLFDLPAHGFSSGKKTNLVEISQIIQQLAKQESPDGKLKALIGHSFGAASAGFAIKKGVSTEHFISISAPTDMDFIFDQFCLTIGASATLRQALVDQVEAILQGSYKQVSL
ncbi:MAG: alpha/beta fold hydrolase, partial [Thiotrichaceae bacterium]